MALLTLKRGPVGPGVYPFRIVAATDKVSQTSGNEYVELTLACLAKEWKGLPVRSIISLSPNARWRAEQFLDAIDAPNEGTFDTNRLPGKIVWAEIETDTSMGEPRANVARWLLPIEGEGEFDSNGQAEDEMTNGDYRGFQPKIKELDATQEEIPF